MTILPPAYGRIAPPRVKNLLIRERLKDLGQQLLAHSVTTVVAPAGYGKSVWVSSLLEETGWPLTAWLNLEQHDAEASNLLYDLIYAIKRILPDFGARSLRTVVSLESVIRDWPIAVTVFIEELPQDLELVLVLDDVHFIHESTVACAVIERILRLMPANIHLVLISRSGLPLKLYRQQLSGNLLEVHGGQLLFTLEETRSLLSLMELTLTAEETAAIQDRTEGWAVGLRLAGIYMKQSGDNPDRVIRLSGQEDSNLCQYLSNELLAALPEQMMDFLLNSSLLPYLETELCNASFQYADSSVMLEQLHNYSFLSREEGQPVTWRIHHLIGDYLAERAAKLRSPGYITAVRSRAGAFLEASGDIDRAIEQAVACSDWTKAASLIYNYGYDYFMRTARLDSLYKWIERLPEDQVAGDHWLLYFKGRSIIQIDDNEAMPILSASAEIAVQKGDVKCEACCLLAMISSAVFAGDLKKEKEVGQRLLAKPLLLKDPQSREAALTAALWHVMFIDDLQQGLKLSRTALRLKLNPEFRINALYISAFIHCRLGNLSYARQLIEEALSVPFVRENELLAVFGYVILSVVLYLAGDDVALEETCLKILPIAQKYNMVIHSGRVHFHRAHICCHEGRYTEGRREFELAHNYFVEGGSISFPNIAALSNMPLRIRTGENAGDLLGEMEDLLINLQAFPYGQGYDYLIFSLGGIVAMEAGELDLARRLLEKSAGRWRQNGAKQNLAGTDMLLAHVYLLQGKESAADSYLRKALSLAEAGQWVNFWEWHDETIYTMCRRAVLKNIHAGWAARLLNRWFPWRLRRELGCLLLSPNEQLRDFAFSLFCDAAKEAGITMIHVFFLGGFRLFINGTEIDRTVWKTQRAEKLIKCLVANRRHHLKDELIEQLWPGSELQSGDASLRTTINYVRKAFGVSGVGMDSVLLRRGEVYLNPKIEVYCDYELFTDEAHKAMHYLETGSPYTVIALDQAARLYKGSFLPEDLYEDWTNNIRTHLQSLYLEVLFKLSQAHYAKYNLTAALQVCRQYLSCEPVDEEAVRLVMEILWQTGKSQKALTVYKELAVALASDYDTVPEPETVTLYKNIRRGGT